MSSYDRVAKYAHISYKKRVKILDMVLKDGFTIKKTSKLLKIKPSTAKTFLKTFPLPG